MVTIEIDDDIILEAGTVQELMKRCRVFSEQSSHRTGEGFSSKMKLFMSELNKMVDCPVCLSVPTKSLVFMCPNRDNICCEHTTQCQSCPICKAPMGDNNYLLAFIVIDSMDHTSPYHGCSKKVYLQNLDMYKMTKEYELVECPGDSCIATLATNHGKGSTVTAVATMKTSKPMF